MQENKTDKVRAALERACIWDVEGAEYYREALRELEGHVIVPVDPTDAMIKSAWKSQYLYVGGSEEAAERCASDRITDHDQLLKDKAAYRDMIAACVKGE